MSNLVVQPQLASVPETERAQIEELNRVLRLGQATLISPDGLRRLDLPDSLYNLLLRIIGDVSEGRPVVYACETQDLTTQQAANLLGMSRQFLVGLLDRGEIPHHMVGSHRRLIMKDVVNYMKQRDQKRRAALDEMAKEAVKAGVYDDF